MSDSPSFEKLGKRNLSVCHKFWYEYVSCTRNLNKLEHRVICAAYWMVCNPWLYLFCTSSFCLILSFNADETIGLVAGTARVSSALVVYATCIQ